MTKNTASALSTYYDHRDDRKSDATTQSVTLELSVTVLDASFTLICDVYSTGVTCKGNNLQL